MDLSDIKRESDSTEETNFYNNLTTSQGISILEPEVKIGSLIDKLDWGFCEKCKTNFYLLKIHKAVFHQNKEEIRCTICGQVFLKKSKLFKHLLQHESNVIECHCCLRKDFFEFEDLFEHLEDHMFLHLYICHICNQSFALKEKFEDHLAAHSSPWKLPFLECFKCEMRFKPEKGGVKLLKKHWLLIHSKQFKCEKCGKKFSRFPVFYNHCLRHLNQLPYSCDRCDLGFRKQSRLKEHIEVVHSDKFSYKCRKCGVKFKYKPSFDAHVRSHDNSLCFSCDHCAKLFLRKVSLLDHFLEKSCSLCDKDFHCRTTFDNHFQTHHVVDRAFKCNECSKSYVLENALKRHKTLVHPKKNENIFRCSHCLYETSTRCNLNRHIRRRHSLK